MHRNDVNMILVYTYEYHGGTATTLGYDVVFTSTVLILYAVLPCQRNLTLTTVNTKYLYQVVYITYFIDRNNT